MLQKWINGATAYGIRHAWLMIAARTGINAGSIRS